MEIEAESVAFLVCRPTRLHSIWERYLHWYTETTRRSTEDFLPSLRLRKVLDAARYIESTGNAGFQSKQNENS